MDNYEDLLARLRQTRASMLGTDDEQHYHDCHDAADAIETLRRERDEAREAASVIRVINDGTVMRLETVEDERDAAINDRDEAERLLDLTIKQRDEASRGEEWYRERCQMRVEERDAFRALLREMRPFVDASERLMRPVMLARIDAALKGGEDE